jgi:outer membrane protein TolC
MKQLIPALLLGSLFSSVSAQAETALTVDAALGLAREHNKDLGAARARLEASAAAIDQARAALLPTLVAQGKYTHNNKEVVIDLGAINPNATLPPIVVQRREQLDGLLSATVPLVVPAAYYQLSAAHTTQRANEASYRTDEASVLYAVAQAYFAAVGTDELVRARQAALSVANETLDVAKARVAAQVANRVDISRAETACVRAEQDLADAINTRESAYRGLGTLVGARAELVLEAAGVPPDEPPPLDALLSKARAQRPELAAGHASRDAQAALARAAAWRWAPSLSGFANGRLFNYAGFSGDRYAWALGVQLDWQLFDGGVRDAEHTRAEASGRAATAQLESIEDTVADEVANARGSLETKRKGVHAAERALGLAKDTLGLVRAQYEAGSALQLDVLQAQDSLVGAEVGLAQAHFDVALADLALRRAIGALPGRTQ